MNCNHWRKLNTTVDAHYLRFADSPLTDEMVAHENQLRRAVEDMESRYGSMKRNIMQCVTVMRARFMVAPAAPAAPVAPVAPAAPVASPRDYITINAAFNPMFALTSVGFPQVDMGGVPILLRRIMISNVITQISSVDKMEKIAALDAAIVRKFSTFCHDLLHMYDAEYDSFWFNCQSKIDALDRTISAKIDVAYTEAFDRHAANLRAAFKHIDAIAKAAEAYTIKATAAAAEEEKEKEEGGEKAAVCGICLEQMTRHTCTFKCSGRHVFHQHCVVFWILKNKGRTATCPVCRG